MPTKTDETGGGGSAFRQVLHTKNGVYVDVHKSRSTLSGTFAT
jgi:hypothetical protein